MPAVILTATHKTANNLTFTIKIWDKEAEEATGHEMRLKPPFFRIKHEGDRNDIFYKILPSNATITIQTGLPDSNENVINFYNTLTESPESRFFVEIIKSPGLVPLFRGKILVDAGDFLEKKFGDFTITAICGLTDLKNIEYRPTDYSDLTPEIGIRTTTFLNHFYDILKRNQVVQFFKDIAHDASSVYPLLTTSVNWTEENSEPGDIISQVKLRNYWFEQISPTYRKYFNCYDVLTDLMTGFICRMYYDQGMYHVEQVSYMDNPEPVIYRYDIDTDDELIAGTTPIKTQQNYTTNANMFARDGVVRRRIAPLKAVELIQSKQFFNYMAGLQVSVATTGGNLGPHNFGYVIGTGNKLVNQWLVEINLGTGWSSAPWNSIIRVEHILTFTVKIGDYYLVADNPIYSGGVVTVGPNGQYHVGNGGKIPVLNWTLEPSTLTIKWEKTFYSTDVNDFNNQATAWRQFIRNSDLVFETNEIQADGEMIYEFLDFVTKRNDVVVGGFPSGSLYLRQNSRIIVASGYSDLYEQPKGIKRYEVGDPNNTEIYSFKLGYYDSPTKDVTNRLFITYPSYPSYFGQPTESWTDPDSELTLPIEDLMMKTALAMRKLPVKLYEVVFFFKNNTMLKFGDQIVINDIVHIILDMEITGNESGFTHYRCTIWEVAKDYIGINVVDTGTPEPGDSPYPAPDGGLDYAFPGDNRVGIEYYKEWEDVATNYVDAEYNLSAMVNLADEYTIKTKWAFLGNGTKWRYKPSGPLGIGQWKFNLDDNRFEFGKGSGNIKYLEALKLY